MIITTRLNQAQGKQRTDLVKNSIEGRNNVIIGRDNIIYSTFPWLKFMEMDEFVLVMPWILKHNN